MAKIGKTEQTANQYYLIAANGFMKEYRKEEIKQVDGDDVAVDEEIDGDDITVEEGAVETNGISIRTRDVNKGIAKLVNIKPHLLHLEKAYTNIKKKKTVEEFKSEVKFVSENFRLLI